MSSAIVARYLALGLIVGIPLVGPGVARGAGEPTVAAQAARSGFWRWVDWGRVRSQRRRVPRNFDGVALYLLTPRNTALLPEQGISLRWTPVAAAQGYRVTVLDGSEPVWTTEVPGTVTRVAYGGPLLEGDRRYRVTVMEIETGVSSSSDVPVGFTVLSAAEAARVETEAAAVRAQGLSVEETAIALAAIYLTYKHSDPQFDTTPLYLQAVQVLQEAIDAGTDNGLVYLLQADGFMGMGVPMVAQERYEAGLERSRQQEDIRVEAEILDGLAIVAISGGDFALARIHTEAAIALYTRLNEPDQVAILQDRLATFP